MPIRLGGSNPFHLRVRATTADIESDAAVAVKRELAWCGVLFVEPKEKTDYVLVLPKKVSRAYFRSACRYETGKRCC